MSETSHEQAEAAIESLGGLDSALGNQDGSLSQQQTPTPQPSTPEPQPHWAEQPRLEDGRWTQPQPQPEQQQPDTSFMGEGFDPDTLTPELQQRYKEMQGHFTRRTQELSDYQRQLASLGGFEELQEAVRVQQALEDPRNWVQLHSELSESLRSMGLSPQEAHEEASRQMDGQQQQQPIDLNTIADDPELAPLKQYIEGLKGELDTVRNEFTDWRTSQEAEQMELALVGEVTRQVNAIRSSRPDYHDGDIDAIYELASYYDGDLFQAQQRYDQIFQDRMQRWMASKSQSQVNTGAIPGAGVPTVQPKSGTWDDARASALEFAAQMDANS